MTPREELLEQLKAFGDQFRAKERGPRDVPSGPCEAGHEPVTDRVPHTHPDDWDRGRRLLCSTGAGRRSRDGEIALETRQFSRQSWEPLDLSIGRPVFDEDVLTLHVAVFA